LQHSPNERYDWKREAFVAAEPPGPDMAAELLARPSA
jgi:hypothetical protein